MPFTASDICKIILAIILPPLGVFLERGCGADLLINILLTILGYVNTSTFHTLRAHNTITKHKAQLTDNRIRYIPGIIHALYIILKY
ncbi:plasma membrane proteolipid Pmp3 [Clarireedia jacksonii]